MEVKLNNVGYSYNLNTKLEQEVIKNIDLVFKENKINTIISTSGGGKTTLMEILAGLLIPTSGSITFIKKGKEALLPTVGLAFKNPEDQFFNRTVKKELEFAINDLPKTKKDEKIKEGLKSVGLGLEYLNKNPFNLSKGEMKKVALASILIYNPKIILLDEPTIGLDDKSKKNLMILLRKLKDKNKTIIITSRDTDFIHQVADYLYVIKNGEIVLKGNKYDVFTNDMLVEMNIELPKIIEFSKIVNNKKIKLGYHDDIKDLMKDIYRHVGK